MKVPTLVIKTALLSEFRAKCEEKSGKKDFLWKHRSTSYHLFDSDAKLTKLSIGCLTNGIAQFFTIEHTHLWRCVFWEYYVLGSALKQTHTVPV